MVDGVLSAQASNASGVGKSDRVSSRGPVEGVRRTSAVGQRAFAETYADAVSRFQTASNDQVTSGSGLLSTGVQVLLAETRSQEAAAPFVAPSNVGRAINTYQETQSQVRDTIQSSGGQVLANNVPANGQTPVAADGNTAFAAQAPQQFVDSSIDG